jgi:flagellar M-ring protein FliF
MDPQQIITRLKTLLTSLQPAQLASLAGAFVLVVGIVGGSAYWVNTPTYVPLFTDMDPETAGDVVTRLKTLKVSYKLDEGGRAVRVPASRVDELKLELMSQGLPSSGRVGFELFDEVSFGATEFLEKVNYRRALEGELARTIGTISEVSNARVHIAMGKDSLFGESRPAKASVVLKLRGQRQLANSSVIGITNLVAASVEGLGPESIVILDSFGRPLAKPAGEDDAETNGTFGGGRQQRLEREMVTRVVAMLEPVVGPDRVRVNVALKLNSETTQQTVESYDPNSVVRSRATTSDSSGAAGAAGLAGARANQPPPGPDAKTPAATQTAAAPPAPAGGPARSTETVNYEIGRVMTVTQKPAGEIARLSVAVIVDDGQLVTKGDDGSAQVTRQARTPEELQKIQGIVAAAVGLEPDRGDTLTVQHMPFEEPVTEPEPALTTMQQVQRYSPQIWEGSRMLLIGLVCIVALLFVVRPLVQHVGAISASRVAQASGAAIAGAGQPLRTVADLENEIEAQLDASTSRNADGRRLPVLARRVSTISAKEPENVAKLLRSWINEGER